ncbi:MAG: hypothetical protein J6A11_03725 [Lachnospiraceae bacterium]|nr:hypothetical protein [Lachnospiraceae bacterium]
MRKNYKDYKYQIFSYAILVVTFAILVLFMHARLDYLLGADESSELLLGKLLAEENHVLSQNWYYSTELRFLNTQLIYALCFKLFSNWHVVRVVASAILYLIMLISYYYLCRQLKRQKYFAITASILLLPFSAEYFIVVLKGLYYIPHISISFLSVGLGYCMAIPICLLNLLYGPWKKQFRILLSVILLGSIQFVGNVHLIAQLNEDDNKELRAAIAFLKQEGYTQGYSTYWKGNLTTELSGGDIEMWIMCDDAAGAGIAEVQDVHTVFCWLQNKSHDNNFPKGKQFIMLTRDEYSRCNWQDKLLLENADYLSDELVIFGFDSEEELEGSF